MKRKILLFLTAGVIASISLVATQEGAETRRFWRDRTALQQMVGEDWGRYSRVMNRRRSNRSYYRPTSIESTESPRSKSFVATANRVPYRWKQRVGIGKTQDVSALGTLNAAEIRNISQYGPQRQETFRNYILKRFPAATEETPDSGVIHWYGIKDRQKVYVNSYQGEGQKRTFQSVPGNYQVGLKFDKNGNYESLGVGEINH